jgi:spore photoproduct lyase
MKKELEKDLFDQKELQTVSKHNIFENYLEPWAKIISNQPWVKNAYYVDAFAGTGKFTKTGEPGSPVIACDILLKHKKQSCRFHCICVEKEPQRYKILEDSLKKFKKVLDVEIYNGEFLTTIDMILDKTKNSPAFFFVDPEGFSGMDFEKIEAILNLPSKEVLINFQYNAIQRWLKAPKVENTIIRLFGTSDFKKVKKEIDLIELYKKQLMKRGSFVWSFRNRFPTKNRTFYYLVYATKNITGFKIMKNVMFSEQSKRYFEPSLFLEVNFQTFQKQIFDKYKGKKSVEYNEVLSFVLQETNYLAKDLDKVLKNICITRTINSKNKHNPFLTFPNHNSNSLLLKNFSHSKYQDLLLQTPFQPSKLKINYKQYINVDGQKEILFSQVNDGSIITRFDKTPLPQKVTDVICPHFIELKWAYGCPFDCSWCYLKGTFRFRREGIKPVIKDLGKVKLHVQTFLDEVKEPEILNTGELADSLMMENGSNAFSKFIIPLFESQNKHKVLFVTKSNNIKNLLQINTHNQAIVSFTLNALPVGELWEKKAPKVLDRIKAAEELHNTGYEVRIRIDPMVPIENWEKYYQELVDSVFSRFTPERITLGSLRGLQSTINGTKDRSWVHYLKETSNWGKKIDFTTRLKMYSSIITYLKQEYKYHNVALCKETKAMWQKLEMNYESIRCNCIW